jgi:HK97 family phage portal protein
MGLLTNIRTKQNDFNATQRQQTPTLEAAFESTLSPYFYPVNLESITRERALTVPALARARGIVCGTLGSLPIHRWDTRKGVKLDPLPIQYQPDPSSSRALTYAMLADSIWFYGAGYVQVLSEYADKRVANFRWIDPRRVGVQTNANGTQILGFTLDGVDVKMDGVGSIKQFQGVDPEGILRRGARTLQTAIELEEAANRAAKEPAPQIVLKNSGVDLPKDKVTAMLDGWKAARRERATAYLNSSIDIQSIGYDPKAMQLVEARQFHASEISRLAGIPAWYLNAEMASATYTNVESERRSLVDFSLRNLLASIESRMAMPDFSTLAVEYRFDLDDFLRGSSFEQMQVITGYTNAGIMTIQEAREEIDMVGEA